MENLEAEKRRGEGGEERGRGRGGGGEEEWDGRGAIESEGRKEERRVREERKGEERTETKDEHLPHTLLTLCSDPPATNSMRIASFGGV